MKKNTLSKSERLSSESRIETLFSRGRRGSVEPLRFCWLVGLKPEVGVEAYPSALADGNKNRGEQTAGLPSALAGGNKDRGEQTAGSLPSALADGSEGTPIHGALAQPGISVLFSVPKKSYKRAWKRNLIKRRMRESYRVRKHPLVAAATAAGKRIDIALICSPSPPSPPSPPSLPSRPSRPSPSPAPPGIPDFKTIDDAIARILEKILARI